MIPFKSNEDIRRFKDGVSDVDLADYLAYGYGELFCTDGPSRVVSPLRKVANY